MALSRVRIFVLFLMVLSPLTAAAQSTFYEAYERGVELQGAGRHQEAREAYLSAAALHPEPETRIKTYGLNFLHRYDPYLRLAQVEIELGLLEDAQAHLGRSAAAGVSSSAEIATVQEALAEALASRQSVAVTSPTPTLRTAEPTQGPQPSPTPAPARLEIESNPTGAEVFIDGLLLGITPVRIPVEPGDHRVELRIDGHQTQVHDLSVERGSTEILSVQLNPLQVPTRPSARIETNETVVPTAVVSSPAPSPTVTPTAPIPSERPVSQAVDDPPRTFPIWTLALLVAVVGLGVVVWLSQRRRQRPQASAISPHLTSEATIDVPSGFRLPESNLPAFGAFGGYKLRKVLGRGGMATTYLADRTRDNLPVALKIPHEHLLHVPNFVERFVREGSLGATIHHPNIVRIYDVGQVGDRPFIAMEFVQGITLSEYLQEQGPMAVRPALEVTRGIALALDYAHVKGVVHRDLKPANVMILPDGSVKVMDFGIAQIAGSPGLTGTDQYLGTPLYSAPESQTPTQIDQRSDLYSLGIVLYALLTGRPPFQADSPLRLLEMHREEMLPAFDAKLEIPARVQDLIKRLTAKSKDDRIASAEVLLAELDAILNEI